MSNDTVHLLKGLMDHKRATEQLVTAQTVLEVTTVTSLVCPPLLVAAGLDTTVQCDPNPPLQSPT